MPIPLSESIKLSCREIQYNKKRMFPKEGHLFSNCSMADCSENEVL